MILNKKKKKPKTTKLICIFILIKGGQSDSRPMRIYRIPLQTLSRTSVSNCSQRRCPSPAEPELASTLQLQPTTPQDTSGNFLIAEPTQHRLLSRSCSSSPTPSHGASCSSSSSK